MEAFRARLPARGAKAKDDWRFLEALHHFAKPLYRGRAGIAQVMGKLKRFKRVALGFEKTARNFWSIVALAATFILVKSVHTA